MTLKEIEDALRKYEPHDMMISDLADALAAERKRIERELELWRRYKDNIDNALNSGDGSYKP